MPLGRGTDERLAATTVFHYLVSFPPFHCKKVKSTWAAITRQGLLL